MAKPNRVLNDEALELVAARFRVLAEPMRLKLLNALGDSEKNVTELVVATRSGQANVSKHLGILLKEGLVARRKVGLSTYYRVTDERTFELWETVCSSLGEHLASQHDAVKRYAKR
jgi:DNA-binding transcriptional ArsR family regulator